MANRPRKLLDHAEGGVYGSKMMRLIQRIYNCTTKVLYKTTNPILYESVIHIKPNGSFYIQKDTYATSQVTLDDEHSTPYFMNDMYQSAEQNTSKERATAIKTDP